LKLFKYTIIAAVLFAGCRDYVTGIGENEPPVLYTGNTSYNVNDSVTVFLQNKSLSSIYVIGAFVSLERNEAGIWNVYSLLVCSEGCPEFSVSSRQIISNSIHVNAAGTYRFVCLYSFTAGVSNGDKIKLYSNEFTVN
jgi:hypothetical protein